MSERIQKIVREFSHKLDRRLRYEDLNCSLDIAWHILISADPSPNKKNLRWLVETYINNGYLWEDITSGVLSKVCETLTEFDKHKRNLEPSQRSLNKYQTLGALWAVISPYAGQLTAGEGKKSDRDRAYNESEIIVDREDGFKVISPKTIFAAKWFGRGTRWCTASERNNVFFYYNSKSPLFIFILPNGDKLQFWQYDNNTQFMDRNDSTVDVRYIEDNWEYLKGICLWINNINIIPQKYLTLDMCKDFVKNERNVLFSIPDKFKTKEICEIAVKNDGLSLYNVPDKLKTFDLCMKAVSENGTAIQYIHQPQNLSSRSIKRYMQKYGSLYDMAVQTNEKVLKNVLDVFKTPELCLKAVSHYPLSLEYVPEHLKTYELCMEAVRKKGMALQFVPEQHKDYNMCQIALLQNGDAYIHVKQDVWDEALYILAIRHSNLSVSMFAQYIVKRQNNVNVLIELVRRHAYNLEYIPDELKTYELCLEAVRNLGRSLQCVPEKYRTYDLCSEALYQNSRALEFVPEELMDAELCRMAVEREPMSLRYVPVKFLTKDLCMIAFHQNVNVFEYIPDQYLTCEMCQDAVEQNRWLAQYVPERFSNDIPVADIIKENEDYLPVLGERDQAEYDAIIAGVREKYRM